MSTESEPVLPHPTKRNWRTCRSVNGVYNTGASLR